MKRFGNTDKHAISKEQAQNFIEIGHKLLELVEASGMANLAILADMETIKLKSAEMERNMQDEILRLHDIIAGLRVEVQSLKRGAHD